MRAGRKRALESPSAIPESPWTLERGHEICRQTAWSPFVPWAALHTLACCNARWHGTTPDGAKCQNPLRRALRVTSLRFSKPTRSGSLTCCAFDQQMAPTDRNYPPLTAFRALYRGRIRGKKVSKSKGPRNICLHFARRPERLLLLRLFPGPRGPFYLGKRASLDSVASERPSEPKFRPPTPCVAAVIPGQT
jgi:hypothetical protein